MYKNRIENVINNMEKMGLNQILITSTAAVFYLTGLWVEPHERMIALYISSDKKAVLFGNEIFGIEKPEGIEYFKHTDNDNPVKHIADFINSGKIGIDKLWPSKFLISLMELRSDIVPVNGSLAVDTARMYKDNEEIKLMRQASIVNDKVISAAISAIKEGVHENELASYINKLFLKNGADCEGVQLVCFGKNGADPHHVGDNTVIKEGDSVIFDIFTPINHYWCDMTRTVFYKSVTDEQKKVYELVKKANEEARKAIFPGVKLCDIDRTARSIIENAGYGKYFTHRLGHNIGLECHEPPDVSSSSLAEAREGMIFSIEPGIYIPDKFGVRIEDLVLVTENGCEVLNNMSRDLHII